jgi:hypothetical protein
MDGVYGDTFHDGMVHTDIFYDWLTSQSEHQLHILRTKQKTLNFYLH